MPCSCALPLSQCDLTARRNANSLKQPVNRLLNCHSCSFSTLYRPSTSSKASRLRNAASRAAPFPPRSREHPGGLPHGTLWHASARPRHASKQSRTHARHDRDVHVRTHARRVRNTSGERVIHKFRCMRGSGDSLFSAFGPDIISTFSPVLLQTRNCPQLLPRPSLSSKLFSGRLAAALQGPRSQCHVRARP